MAITEISIIHHVAIVLLLLWLLNAFGYGSTIVYLLALLYLFQVNERYVKRLRRKLQFEQRRNANQKRVLLESETVRWLNHAIEKIWPVCMEEIASQKIFLPIIPWFLDKYKPWTVKKAAVEHLYLGRKPPFFTDMRVLNESSDDDHLVLELGLSFLTAEDMSGILAAKLRRRLGFGIVAKMHITSMHVEGKVLVGVKFLRDWPYIGRLRICFAEPPYFQMSVKPIFNHGVDVTEVPGIAGWLDKLLEVAFEETLVQPNMLVVDMEKFVSPQSPEKGSWFSILVKDPIAYVRVEVIEGSEMKVSDINGLSDPYVKAQLGQYKFKTNIQRKTLSPKWQEEFKIPICSWESDNVLTIDVHDKDPIMKRDDHLGVCSVDIGNFRDGQRHDMWIPLENVKTGRLHLAVTVVQADSKDPTIPPTEDEKLAGEDRPDPPKNESTEKQSGPPASSKKSRKFPDTFEPIDIDGQKETGMWIHHPGSDVSQTWEHRKSSIRRSSTIIEREGETPPSKGSQQHDSSSDESEGSGTPHRRNIFKTGLNLISKALHRKHKKDDAPDVTKEPVPSPQAMVKAVDANRAEVKHMEEETVPENPNTKGSDDVESEPESTRANVEEIPKGPESLSKAFVEEDKIRGIDDAETESSDESSLSSPLNGTFVQGVPIASTQATSDGDGSPTANPSADVQR